MHQEGTTKFFFEDLGTERKERDMIVAGACIVTFLIHGNDIGILPNLWENALVDRERVQRVSKGMVSSGAHPWVLWVLPSGPHALCLPVPMSDKSSRTLPLGIEKWFRDCEEKVEASGSASTRGSVST